MLRTGRQGFLVTLPPAFGEQFCQAMQFLVQVLDFWKVRVMIVAIGTSPAQPGTKAAVVNVEG